MIRTATIEDKNQISELFEALTGKKIPDDEIIRFVESSPIDCLYVKIKDDKVVDLLGFRIRENSEENSRYGEISLLVVSESYKRTGIGRELIAFAEDLSKRNGCIGTWLVSGFGREENAHQFYKSIGYEITGYRFVKRISRVMWTDDSPKMN